MTQGQKMPPLQFWFVFIGVLCGLSGFFFFARYDDTGNDIYAILLVMSGVAFVVLGGIGQNVNTLHSPLGKFVLAYGLIFAFLFAVGISLDFFVLRHLLEIADPQPLYAANIVRAAIGGFVAIMVFFNR